MRSSLFCGSLSLLALLLPSLSSSARAQTEPPPPAASPESEACFPACRTGYVCARGACVSRCNPPCPADDMCTAQGECAAKPPAPQAAPQEEWKSHRFFFRAGGGAGYFDVAATVVGFSSVGGVDTNYAFDTSFNGPAAVGQLSIGGVVAPGLVVGGDVMGTSGTLKDSQGSGASVKATYVLMGPFVDYFFLRHGGPHLLASTGYVVRESSGVWGISAGAGYDFAIGAGWELGGLARFAFSPEMSDEKRAILATFELVASYR